MMNTISIVPSVTTALQHIVPLFNEALGPDIDKLHLGGGTVLASRWQHRLSTDLDFFLHETNPADTRTLLSAISTRIKQRTHTYALTDIQIAGGHLSFKTHNTRTSIFTTPRQTNKLSEQRERVTHILLESTEEILAKKLYGRIIGNGEFTKRDFYDFCVAEIQEPEALNAILQSLGDERELIHTELKNKYRSELIRDAEHGPPLLEPAYPDIAGNLWDRAANLFQREPTRSRTTDDRTQDDYDIER